MEKILKNYRNNLIILMICFVGIILFNLHLFLEGEIVKLILGIILLLLCSTCYKCFELFNNDILKSTSIAIKIGPIMSLITIAESFVYNGIINFRIGCLFVFVGGILICKDGKKIHKHYTEN